jgi:hypothetical protein
VEFAIPVFDYKNHISIDRAHAFVHCFSVTSAAAHGGAQLDAVLDKADTASAVWADTVYRSAANDGHMAHNGMRSLVHFRRRPGADLTSAHKKANRARTKIGLANLVYNVNDTCGCAGNSQPPERRQTASHHCCEHHRVRDSRGRKGGPPSENIPSPTTLR